MNPYPYVLNNPLKYVDPLGLSPMLSEADLDDGIRAHLENIRIRAGLEPEISINEIMKYNAFGRFVNNSSQIGCDEGTGKTSIHAEDRYLSDEEMKVNAEYIFNDFKSRGWSTEAAVAIIANFEHESTINPGRWQVGKEKTNKFAGFGLVQWTPAKEFLKEIELTIALAEQMAVDNPQELMDKELNYFADSIKPNRGNWFGKKAERYYITADMKMSSSDFVVSTGDVGDLAMIYHAMYVRSADTYEMVQGRVEKAHKWYEYFNK